jgi:dTDP-4-dehydrorhamnose 3,5-epimerase
VIKGEIFDVAVDLRKNSPTYKKVFTEKLSEKNCKSIYIPAGFAHGFLTLGKENIVCYSCTEYRSVGNEYGIAYNDPTLKIKWPRNKVIITKKDKSAKTLSELIEDKII